MTSMKKHFYDDAITAAMMFKHHGVKFSEIVSNKRIIHNGKP